MNSVEIIEDAFRPEVFQQSFIKTVEEFDTPSQNGMSNSAKIALAILALGLFAMAIPMFFEYLESKGYLKRKEDEENPNQGY